MPASATLRASVTALSGTPVEGQATPVLVDGSDTPITANGLAGYTPTPGDRLLVQQVGSTVEILQWISRGTVPYVSADALAAVAAEAAQASSDAGTALSEANAATEAVNTLNSTTLPGLSSQLATLDGKFPITAADIAANTITANQIAANTITANQIAAGTITANQIAAGTITANELDIATLNGETITGTIIETASSGRRAVLGTDLFNIPDASNIAFFNDANTEYPGVVGPYTSGTDSALAVTSPQSTSEVERAEIDLVSSTVAGASLINLDASVTYVQGTLNLPNQAAASYAGNGTAQTFAASTWYTIANYSAVLAPRGGIVFSGGVASLEYGGLYMFIGQWGTPAGTAANTELQGRFLVNGATAYGQNLTIVVAHSTAVQCVAFISCNAGDQVQLQGWANAAVTTNNTSVNQAFSCFRFG